MSIRKRLALGAATAILGLVLGATVLSPIVAGAQESTTTTAPDGAAGSGRVDRIRDALEALVTDGTITAAQANAVAEHLSATLPGPGGRFLGRGHVLAGLDIAAETIGIERSVLVDALRDGQSIADVATANGTDPQAVIDAMVAAHQAKLDELVADGSMTAEEAAERSAGAVERITALVNGEFEFRRGFIVRPDRDAPTAAEGA